MAKSEIIMGEFGGGGGFTEETASVLYDNCKNVFADSGMVAEDGIYVVTFANSTTDPYNGLKCIYKRESGIFTPVAYGTSIDDYLDTLSNGNVGFKTTYIYAGYSGYYFTIIKYS